MSRLYPDDQSTEVIHLKLPPILKNKPATLIQKPKLIQPVLPTEPLKIIKDK